ncbi:uncharacterized protein [Drosophila suzukii]|uniref:Uncharacterized protein isoform X2 n=1 Tax=Drosophila suzukii TaxID=28584 RepID=A0ABM4TY84_DROSZ
MHLAWSHCQAVGIFPKHAAQPKAMRLEGVGAELGARFFCWYCKKSFNIMEHTECIHFLYLANGAHRNSLRAANGVHRNSLTKAGIVSAAFVDVSTTPMGEETQYRPTPHIT